MEEAPFSRRIAIAAWSISGPRDNPLHVTGSSSFFESQKRTAELREHPEPRGVIVAV
jgi:hypothetical protein